MSIYLSRYSDGIEILVSSYALLLSCSDEGFVVFRMCSITALAQDSITCKLCNEKFESLGDMQYHVLTEHMQKGDYRIPLEKRNTS